MDQHQKVFQGLKSGQNLQRNCTQSEIRERDSVFEKSAGFKVLSSAGFMLKQVKLPFIFSVPQLPVWTHSNESKPQDSYVDTIMLL